MSPQYCILFQILFGTLFFRDCSGNFSTICPNEGVIYDFVLTPVAMSTARSQATTMGGWLAQPNTLAKQRCITDLFSANQAAIQSSCPDYDQTGPWGSFIWIGGTDEALEGFHFFPPPRMHTKAPL